MQRRQSQPIAPIASKTGARFGIIEMAPIRKDLKIAIIISVMTLKAMLNPWILLDMM